MFPRSSAAITKFRGVADLAPKGKAAEISAHEQLSSFILTKVASCSGVNLARCVRRRPRCDRVSLGARDSAIRIPRLC